MLCFQIEVQQYMRRCYLVVLVMMLCANMIRASIITGFTLLKTPSTIIGPLPSIINLSTVGSNLSIIANTNSNDRIAKVRFWFDEAKVKAEAIPPYAITSNRVKDIYDPFPRMTQLGQHSVVAIAYDMDRKILCNKSFSFNVVANDDNDQNSNATRVPSLFETIAPTPPTKPPTIFVDDDGYQSSYPPVLPTTLPKLEPVVKTKQPITLTPTELPDHQTSIPIFPSNEPTKLPSKAPSIRNRSYPPTFIPFQVPTLPAPAPHAMFPSNAPTKLPSKAPSIRNISYPPTFIPFQVPTPPAPTTDVFQTFVPSSESIDMPITITPHVNITGELRKWHKITLDITGPFADEVDPDINPFLNYRFNVTFVHRNTQRQYVVPGYFAADGNAAESSATSGSQWFCHFTPDAVGIWMYRINFVHGTNVAISDDLGIPVIDVDGLTGLFTVRNTNKVGRDHRGKGRLQYVGEHHLRFAETGEWFLKVGADSPENFLAYSDFDNTPNYRNFRKSWSPHIQHYNIHTDPSWQNGKGTGIIGAINYLSNQGMNGISFLTMNINGDDRNVYPYVNDNDLLRFDVSKLAQWEIVMNHADHMGINLHIKLAERENDRLFDNRSTNDIIMGNERKLYYRELIARFGHHLALNWNIGEEYTNTIKHMNVYTDYIKRLDPYCHPIVSHSDRDSMFFTDMLGYPTYDGVSLQLLQGSVFVHTLKWVTESAMVGRKWIVSNDEQGPARYGVLPDTMDPDHDTIRQQVLWGNIMAGGSGVEYYFGYNYNDSDLTCEDYSSRENMWKLSRHMLDFFSMNEIPFWSMSYDPHQRLAMEHTTNEPSTEQSSIDWLLSTPRGGTMVIYKQELSTRNPSAESNNNSINMHGLAGTYTVKWYNPRSGGTMLYGSIRSIACGNHNSNSTIHSYGTSPNPNDTKDWVLLIRKASSL